jgi:amino acid adenylation domain-containing protein/non-ribosomal peptide synthase protein (TIGR01720 family)
MSNHHQEEEAVGITRGNKEREYWLAKLSGEIQKSHFPYDYIRPAGEALDRESLHFKMSGTLFTRLMKLSNQSDLKLHMILTAGLLILLYKYTGSRDIIIGTPVLKQEVEANFINSVLALRCEIKDDMTFKEFLLMVRQTVIEATENQNYPIETLVYKLGLKSSQSDFSLFDAAILLENIHDISYIEHIKYNLLYSFLRTGENIEVRIDYNPLLYNKATMERINTHFCQALETAVFNVEQPISEIGIITAQEKNRVLYEFNKTKKDIRRDQCYRQLFEEQAGKTPGKIAAVHKTHHITYRELQKEAGSLAGYLREKGVKPGEMVALYMSRSIKMLTSILGVFMVEAAYLPVDVDYPVNRIRYILEKSEVTILITVDDQEEVVLQLHDSYPFLEQILCLPRGKSAASVFPAGNGRYTSPPGGNTHELAYVIFTSGTTGKPKGVMIHQLGMINHIYAKINEMAIVEDDVIAQTASACFDISVWQFLTAPVVGGRVLIVEMEFVLNPQQFLKILLKEKVTIWESVPSLMIAFLDAIKDNRNNELKHLRWMMLTGEALSAALAGSWNNYYPGIKLINAYGPTEASDDVTHYVVDREPPGTQKGIPIGKALQNLHVYIMDQNLSLCPVGVRGEICVSGIGVGKGYWKEPQKTALSFVTNPYGSEIGDPDCARLYKTGDIGYFRHDGVIVCLGRKDRQIKVRGNRIELGEIETQMLTHDKIKEVAVLANKDKKGDYFLCAYFVLKSPAQAIPGASTETSLIFELREFLLKELPDYMVPAYFIRLEQIPLTPNGKIDKKALPEPELKVDEQYVPPGNELEKKLVEIYESVLDKKDIGINENFFMIGGDSIKSIQIISRLTREGYKVEMRDLFDYPTILELAPVVKPSDHTSDQSIVTGRVPLTPIQENFFANYRKSPHHFNLSSLLYLTEPLEEEIIRAIFKKIQDHHDALRMTFKKGEGGEIIQTGHGPDYPLSLEVYDLRQEENAGKIFEQQAAKLQAGIELENGPMMKLGLFHLEKGTRLLIVLHHLVSDGVSWRILFEDMEILYQQHKKGETFKLPLKTDSYKIWAEKLKEYSKSQSFLKQKAYWEELESTVVPPIEKDFAEESNDVKDADSLSFSLDREATALLLTKANEAFNTEVNDILLTALGLSIKEVFGPGKVAVVRESHGREDILEKINVSRTVGWFTSEYPVILDLSYAGDLSRQVREIKESLHSVSNGGIDYGVLKYLAADRHSREVNFKLKPRVIFNYLGQFDRDVEQVSFAKIEEFNGNAVGLEEKREFELEVVGMIAKKRLLMTIMYNKKHYKAETMEKLLGQYKEKLSRLILYCANREKREYSPGDFTYRDLSLEEIDALSARYEEKFGGDATGKKGLIRDIYTLSPMQEGMLFHSLYETTSLAYFIQINYRIRGKFEIPVIKKSLEFLFKRHDILRTVFVYEDVKRPIQVVLNHRQVDFHGEDIRGIKGKDERELYVKRYKEKDKQRLFDLFTDVLMRVAVIRLDETEYEFTWSFHHILMDGWCIGIIIREFTEIYNRYLESSEPQLAPVKPYRTYIQWLEKQDREVTRSYWAGYLQDYGEAAKIGVMKSGKTLEQGYNIDQVNFSLDAKETRGMHELASKNYVTLNTLIQVVWGILLGRYNRKEDVVFGAVVSGRPPGLEGVEK